MSVKTVYVPVDVSMEDFEDDDIAEEYESRGLGGGGDLKESIEKMFYAFKLGKAECAIELARQIAQEATGRILP